METRIEYIDTAKGILIIMMLIGHIWNIGFTHDFIYAFHMPAFFILAGMLFRYSSALEKSLWSALAGKMRSLLVPYFFLRYLQL